MNGLMFPLTCPNDGGEVDLLAEGSGIGAETRAMVQCRRCQSEFLVIVALQTVVHRREKRARLEVVA